MVFTNSVRADSAELPFGGVKPSGFGRKFGRHGLDEFATRRPIRPGFLFAIPTSNNRSKPADATDRWVPLEG
nr:aldehyde dehydrogenase family protein [Arthrobacter sp. efr-133-TYG-118]